MLVPMMPVPCLRFKLVIHVHVFLKYSFSRNLKVNTAIIYRFYTDEEVLKLF